MKPVLVLGFLGLCTFSIAAAVALSSDPPGSTAIVVAVIAFAVTAAILARQARKDLDAVLILLAVFSLGTAICMGIYLFSAHLPGLAPKVATGLSIAAAAGLGIITLQRQRRGSSPDFPDVLGSRFQPQSLLEVDGIQFCGVLQSGGSGRPHTASIFLQNCFNAPRDVTITFDGAGYSKYMRFHPRYQARIGAAEVVQVSFPVITPTYPGSYRLYFSFTVAGSGGKRVRLWRARQPTTRVKPGAQAAALAAGVIAWGGGVSFTVGPLPDDIWSMELPAPVQQTLWRPRPGADL